MKLVAFFNFCIAGRIVDFLLTRAVSSVLKELDLDKFISENGTSKLTPTAPLSMT
jgi:hypothetical protein